MQDCTDFFALGRKLGVFAWLNQNERVRVTVLRALDPDLDAVGKLQVANKFHQPKELRVRRAAHPTLRCIVHAINRIDYDRHDKISGIT